MPPPGRHAHGHRYVRKPQHPWVARNPSTVPASSQSALKQAIKAEGLDDAEFDDLLWIMAQESGGVVDIRNAHSTARGLFQLLKDGYSLNPKGEASFGNAVEECQGGIHYIVGRYHTAKAARAFWEKHHWY